MKMLATLVLTADVSLTPTQIKALVERARQTSGLQYASEPDSGCLILSSQVEHKFVLLLWSERRRSVALELQDCSMGIARSRNAGDFSWLNEISDVAFRGSTQLLDP